MVVRFAPIKHQRRSALPLCLAVSLAQRLRPGSDARKPSPGAVAGWRAEALADSTLGTQGGPGAGPTPGCSGGGLAACPAPEIPLGRDLTSTCSCGLAASGTAADPPWESCGAVSLQEPPQGSGKGRSVMNPAPAMLVGAGYLLIPPQRDSRGGAQRDPP
eukprot:CAMPEP_0206247932 /NCGR_PEP_ID=MMETSP0047_2-20121206/20082_1 /ASSEMBLY_ACC=CAM_ASM_000192 /TAXON_ID=195065 /ORGANISM="Chroomonas mesostigmatica_cf, Strain CCMP1168" /LENGTH=159 /DNA_ID=CAMNT_0053673507 /DNA_START=384 /DNA_END=860 /DNA_ORIENTATION=+